MSVPTDARVDVPAQDWPDAVRRTADLLVELGVADESYPQACVDSVAQHGPYLVMAPGFALVHARPEQGAVGVGVSGVRLAEQVVSGHKSNDPVDLLIGFCSPDEQQHLIALTALGKALATGLADRLREAFDAEDLSKQLHEVLDE